MRLKRLELFGFKSFADRTVFEFGDQTLTGVVGPNGCGKSNVVDSVRWVLGEQRPTSMRGAEMTDVIFKGSTSRAPLSVAEVTLVLDNAPSAGALASRALASGTTGPGALPGSHIESRGAEIAITRRVFQSGEGEYLIDGDAVRLKDVREMLYDTGLGSRGYSVLEQGRIDAVLSANPLERRRVFEEAAGISRYRQRKVEAELRLKKVGEDSARLDDLLGELSTRVRSLKIQAGKAERFVLARDEWAHEKARLYRHRLGHHARDLELLSSELARLEAELTRQKGERAGHDERAASLERERDALAAEIERLAADSARLSGEGRALDERRAQLSARAAGLEQGAREEGERGVRLSSQHAERSAELERLTAELAELDAELARASATEAEHRTALENAEREAQAAREAAERVRDEALAAFGSLNQAENAVRSLGDAAALSRTRAERAREKLAGAVQARDELETDAAALEVRAEETENAHAKSDEDRRRLGLDLEECEREIRALDVERGALDVERARVQGRIDALLDRERDLEELSEAARAVLEQSGADGGPCAPEELLGLVADHLRTDSARARALDAALAARGRAIVARDRAAAARIAGWLKQRERGSVGLLLAAGLAATRRGAPPAPQGSDAELVLSRLLDDVRCTAGCEPLRELLIGDVYVARDLDAALSLAERHPALRFATLEGDLADAAGLLACGSGLTLGPVGRRSSADDLAGELARLSEAIAVLSARRGELVLREQALEDDARRTSAELDLAVSARAEAESRLSSARERLCDLEEDRAALERDRASAETELQGLERDLAAAERAFVEARSRSAAAQADLSGAEARAGALAAEREAAASAAAQARVDAARAREREGGLRRRRGDLEAVALENRAEMERAQRLSREHVESARQAKEQAEVAAARSANLQEERGRLEERLTAARERDERERESVQAARACAEALQRELDLAAATLSERRLDEQRLALARADVLRRAAEELALDEAALRGGLDGGLGGEEALATSADLDALEASVHELKERLDKLGPVNMEAMAELTEVGSRLDYLQKQRDDLLRAGEALNATLRTIDTESKRLFLETFEAVRANFQRIFRQLFGGGRADVTLEDGADVLDAGVEIVARPPGRELLPIGLLSGGQRTLTALALLFAVFEARPSPFCILDEVDAALDDANIERFLSMLDGFRRSTQFIVVTHNKGTMAACQGLYGVTMETKGVSRQVAVELDEAERWTAGANREKENGHGANGQGENGRGENEPGSATPETGDRSLERGPALDPESGEPLVELVPRAVPTAAAEDRTAAGVELRPSARRPRSRRKTPDSSERPPGGIDAGRGDLADPPALVEGPVEPISG